MKGPYERLKYTLQRVWECPACKHRERTHGSVTNQYCRCQNEIELLQQVSMKLVKDGVRCTIRPNGPNGPNGSNGPNGA